MERIELEQNTPEWLEYRNDHRNASEAGTIMGVNPYQTPYELRVEKDTGISNFEGNIATDHGHRWEDTARIRVEGLLDIDLTPAIFREGAYSASLDAYGVKDNESVKVEIKCPFQRERSKLWKQAQIDNASWDQVIPEHYMWQIVHQEMVCPTARTYFFIYIPEKGDEPEDFRLFECFPDDYQKSVLVEAWDRFFDEPPQPPTKKVSDPVLIAHVQTLKELKKGEEAVKIAIKEIEADLKAAGKDIDLEFPDGTTIKRQERQGAVDYKKVPELKGVDLEPYRKKSSKYQVIKLGDA